MSGFGGASRIPEVIKTLAHLWREARGPEKVEGLPQARNRRLRCPMAQGPTVWFPISTVADPP